MVDGDKIIASRVWLRQNYGWPWVVMGSDGKIMAGRGWLWVVTARLWLVVAGRGWSHDLVMLV